MIYIGNKIVFFFKPLIAEAKRITVACLVADNTLILKWAKKLEYFELFAAKVTVIHKRANEFHRIKNLHAKVFCFDDRVFLSSANLTYGSLFTNIEHAIEVEDPKQKAVILSYLEKLRHEKEKRHMGKD